MPLSQRRPIPGMLFCCRSSAVQGDRDSPAGTASSHLERGSTGTSSPSAVCRTRAVQGGAPRGERAAAPTRSASPVPRPRRWLRASLAAALFASPLTLSSTVAAPLCEQGDEIRIWTSPRLPSVGGALGILAVATDGEPSGLRVSDPAGGRLAPTLHASGGPPWSLSGTLYDLSAGRYRIDAIRDGQVVACREVAVENGVAEPGAPGDFPLRRWDLAAEALYSAWIERLFDAPPEQSPSFPSLQPLLRDPNRNFLHDHLRRGEDAAVPATPDCADLPYFLRAYFAWKMGLPISYRPCTRGTATSPPSCGAPLIDQGFASGAAPPASFTALTRKLMDTVHSGSARTALDAEHADFYPIPLERSAIWPGTVFADPYGHVLVVVKWIPQSLAREGLLLAVDAQPDNTIGRKRFWEGTFLFSSEVPGAGAGFKAFRPLLGGGRPRPASNGTLRDSAGFMPYSSEQGRLAADDFYARMGSLINPAGLEPDRAYEATLAALMEQLETRVTSVENGEAFMRSHPGTVIAMPRGSAIFETIGPWEDYSTPSRDMRLLIAMKVLEGLPERILRYPELFVLGGETPSGATARIARLHDRRLGERSIAYTRSDGSPWRLSLSDIYHRRSALEMGYNPNDCVELRWGAAIGTAEADTCKRHAPRDQRARMEEYRQWFRDTRRPPR